MAKKKAAKKKAAKKAERFAWPAGRLRVTFRNGLAQIVDGDAQRRCPRFTLEQVARVVDAASGDVLYEAA